MGNNDYFNILNDITLDDIPLKDIFSRYSIFNNTENFTEYQLKDSDTLLTLAKRFYGSTRFWWVIALYNDIIDPFYDLSLSEDELRDYINKYIDEEGESGETFNELYTDYTIENETKRTLKILDPTLLQNILKQFKDEVEKINT